MEKRDEARSEQLITKVPVILAETIEDIKDKENRTRSTVIYYLVLRGVKEYLRDGKLPTTLESLQLLDDLKTKASKSKRKQG